MEVNNVEQHCQIIYPQNLRKYTGHIEEVRSKNNHYKIVSFRVRIRSPNFKFSKCFPSRVEAKCEFIKQNIENKLEIKNTMQDCGNHYLVKLSGGKEFLADKIDLHFIEAHTWFSSYDYASCNQNGRQIKFHNLILNHNPTINSLVDHVNCCPLDNRRINLQIAT